MRPLKFNAQVLQAILRLSVLVVNLKGRQGIFSQILQELAAVHDLGLDNWQMKPPIIIHDMAMLVVRYIFSPKAMFQLCATNVRPKPYAPTFCGRPINHVDDFW